MDTKDTIDTLRYHFNTKMGLMKSVVELLQRGEKDHKILEKLRSVNANISIFSESSETISVSALDIYLDEIERECN